jgi:scyllo-inositol 2-dehydrogenase (NADP+)
MQGEVNMEMKLGIIGFGGMAHWHWENAPKAGVKVVAATDIDPERLAMARGLGLRAYESAEGLLADEDVNFVLVATPNQVHKELAIAALRAGKHVMVEKPATLSVADWDEMVRESEKAGKILTVHQNRRWDKDYLTMRKIVESGELGRVYSIESRVFGSGGAMFGWRAFKEFGGGMLLDWGVHLVDQLMNMYPGKKVKSVYARLMFVMKQEVDDYDKLMLTLEDGTTLQVEICTYAFRTLPRWFVIGDGGTLTIQEFECGEGGYTVPRHTTAQIAPIVVMTAAGPTRMMAPRPPESREDFPLPQVQCDWTELYGNLIDVMNGRAGLIVTPASVRRVLQVLEALFRSAQEHRSLEVSI